MLCSCLIGEYFHLQAKLSMMFVYRLPCCKWMLIIWFELISNLLDRLWHPRHVCSTHMALTVNVRMNKSYIMSPLHPGRQPLCPQPSATYGYTMGSFFVIFHRILSSNSTGKNVRHWKLAPESRPVDYAMLALRQPCRQKKGWWKAWIDASLMPGRQNPRAGQPRWNLDMRSFRAGSS